MWQYAIWCELQHFGFALFWLAVPFLMLTTYSHPTQEAGDTTGRFLLFFLLSWGLHIFADTYGLGF
jgi:hypothetical protein